MLSRSLFRPLPTHFTYPLTLPLYPIPVFYLSRTPAQLARAVASNVRQVSASAYSALFLSTSIFSHALHFSLPLFLTLSLSSLLTEPE
jgi:uncharacterized membrane protein SpoIIM required for sporulation